MIEVGVEGKIVRLPKGSVGYLGVRCLLVGHHKHGTIWRKRRVWPIEHWQIYGEMTRELDDAVGQPAIVAGDRVDCYLGRGCWLHGSIKL